MYCAEAIHYAVDGGGDGVRIRDVGREGSGFPGEFRGGLLGQFGVAVDDGDLAPLANDRPGGGPAESRRPAGDDRDLVPDVHEKPLVRSQAFGNGSL